MLVVGFTFGDLDRCDQVAHGLVEAEGYVFSDPSRSHRFVFVDQATQDIDPANAWRVG